MAEFDKERFDAWMALATFRRDLKDSRSSRQWHALFTAWAGIALLITQAHAVPSILNRIVAGSAFLILGAWSVWHARGSERDQKIMFDRQDEAARLLGIEVPAAIEKPWFRHPPVWMQLGTTTLLCVVLAVV